MIRTPSKKVALLSTRQAFQYDMPVRERFDPTGYVQGTFDIEELEETKETSKTLMGTHASASARDDSGEHVQVYSGSCQWPRGQRYIAATRRKLIWREGGGIPFSEG